LGSGRRDVCHKIFLNFKFVGYAAFGGCFNLSGVFEEDTVGGFEGGLFPGCLSFGQFIRADLQGDGVFCCVEFDGVIVVYEGDGAAFVCFGGDMADDEAVGAAAEAAVGDEGDAFAEAGADDGRSRLEHFGHAGCSFGADVADDDDIAGPDLAGVDAGDEFVLTIEDAGGAFEAFAFFAADLGYAAA
jgi:hypothetical protein